MGLRAIRVISIRAGQSLREELLLWRCFRRDRASAFRIIILYVIDSVAYRLAISACTLIPLRLANPSMYPANTSNVRGFKAGKTALALNPRATFVSATNPEVLPQPEPRTVGQHFIVASIRRRDVGCTQRSNIRRFEHFLKLLDVVNDAFHVHASQYPT